MPRLIRLLPGLALLLALAVSWFVFAGRQAPMPERPAIPVSAWMPGQVVASPRVVFRGAAAGMVEATLVFRLPATQDEHWVLWLPHDPFDEVVLAADGWSPRPQRYFRPDVADGLLPAGFGFALPRDWSGEREVHLRLRGGVRAAPTPSIVSEREALRRVARDSALSYAVYSAMVTLGIAAFALFMAVRDIAFLAFVVYAAAGLLLCGIVNGHLYGLPGMGWAGGLGGSGFWGGVLLFAGVGLHTVVRYAAPPLRPRWLRWLPWAIGASAAFVPLLPDWAHQANMPQFAATFGWMLSLLVGIGVVHGALRRGVPMAAAVLVALLVAGASMAAHELMQAGRLADTLFTRYAYQLALVLLSVVLFVGLSSRIGLVRRRLDDETSARRRSERHLRQEQARAGLSQALQDGLRALPAEHLVPTAMCLLGDTSARMTGARQAAVAIEGDPGDPAFRLHAGPAGARLVHALAGAEALLRSQADAGAPGHLRLVGGRISAMPESPLHALVPIPLAPPAWGMLVLAIDDALADDDLAALADLARLAATGVADARAAHRLRRTAEHDGLTGTLNRRALDELLAREFVEASGGRRPLSVLFIDIDRFKRVNDERGHACGDHCLRALSGALRGELRPSDALGRYGGEEFLVVLPGHDAAAALALAERLRLVIEGLRVPWRAGDVCLTVSIGLAARRPDDADPATLLDRADRALYAAKHGGRNCVRVAGCSGAP